MKKFEKIVLFMLSMILSLQVISFGFTMSFKTQQERKEQACSDNMTHPMEDVVVMPEIDLEAFEPRIDCPLDDQTQHMIYEKCEKYNIDFAFTMGLIFWESSFDPKADSGSSKGLMQINKINLPKLKKELGVTDLFDPAQNVEAGLFMLHDLFEKYDDPVHVLMAYNMGESGAAKLIKRGVYSTEYAENVLKSADEYQQEINERMGW